MASHAKSTQNNEFNVKDEVDISSADKLQRFFQIDTIILGVCDQVCLNYTKQHVCYFFAIVVYIGCLDISQIFKTFCLHSVMLDL